MTYNLENTVLGYSARAFLLNCPNSRQEGTESWGLSFPFSQLSLCCDGFILGFHKEAKWRQWLQNLCPLCFHARGPWLSQYSQQKLHRVSLALIRSSTIPEQIAVTGRILFMDWPNDVLHPAMELYPSTWAEGWGRKIKACLQKKDNREKNLQKQQMLSTGLVLSTGETGNQPVVGKQGMGVTAPSSGSQLSHQYLG